MSAVSSTIRREISWLVPRLPSVSRTYIVTAWSPPCIAPTVWTPSIPWIRPITWSLIAWVSAVEVPSGVVRDTEIWLESVSGMKAVPIRVTPKTLTPSSTAAPISTGALCRRVKERERA